MPPIGETEGKGLEDAVLEVSLWGAEAELGEEGHRVGVALGRQMEAIHCQFLLINVVG